MKIRTVVGLILILSSFITILGTPPTNFDNIFINARAEVLAAPIESENILIDISMNASAIGPNSVIEFSVELTNALPRSLYNLSVNTSDIPADLLVTPSSIPLFTQTSLDPGLSTSFEFVTKYSGDSVSSAVDLLLIIDASGSMQDEITSVITELNNLISTLSTEIPELRIGVIVFGWSRFNEYPTSDANNYVPFTNDFESIKDLINSLYASGGDEPWGDALYLANSWDWREDANKLIVLVGDEDCDPGLIVGNEDTSDSYNGTDLLDVVVALKNKGVMISTVICGGADYMTENQFQWIAAYTDGTSVYLPQLESEGINLPSIIQEWTLELAREYYREIDLTVVWQDETGKIYFNKQTSSFWLDFSPPSAIISETISPTGMNQYSVDFLIDVDDISPISFVNLYHNAYGSWEVDFLTPIENTSYYHIELQNVAGDVNLSYLVESSDNLQNIGRTSVFWIIVEPKFDAVGEEVAIWAETDDQVFSNVKVTQSGTYYYILSGPADINMVTMSFIEIDTNETNFALQEDYFNVSSSYWRKIFRFSLNPGDHAVTLSIPSDSGNFTMSYVWVILDKPVDEYFSGSMTDTVRVYGVEWQATNGTYFSFNNEQYSPLVLIAEVYTSNWERVSTFVVTESLMVPKNDTYFILIWATLRTGDFIIQNTEYPPDSTFDPYYTQAQGAIFFPNVIFILAIMVSLTIFSRKERKQK